MNKRNESYIYGGYLFDVERAKKIAFDEQYVSHLVPAHRSIGGAKVSLPKDEYDLSSPVIFLSFIHPIKRGLGILLVDGNHRMQWAAKYHLKLEAIFLNPPHSFECSAYHNPIWPDRIWGKLTASARFYGVEFGGHR